MARLKERCSYLVYIAQHKKLRKKLDMSEVNYKAVFITLTLSSAQIHSDRVIKEKLLKPLLRQLRNQFKVQNYIWKAEANNNGNIHFHITVDRYVPWRMLRSNWNMIQESLGYITRCSVPDPNSTDVHAVYKINNIGGYLSKYISKNDLYKENKPAHEWKEHFYKELLNIEGCPLEFTKINGQWVANITKE